MFGFINIYKPKGKTSHDIVAILRRITKVKQIGHTGTLDPFAEGVLPICIGKATRLIEYLDDDKAYIGTVQFGTATDTYDLEGKVVKTSEKKVKKDDVEKVLKIFEGEIEQKPPIYSALKVKGKKLYEYARKGEEVEIKSRKVEISEIKLLNFDEKNQNAEIYIACSKGTYIRSIANDMGEFLGVYGHLIKLVRVKAGGFCLEKSVKLEDLTIKNVENNLVNPLDYLNYPKYEVNEFEKEKISHGSSIKINDFNNQLVILMSNKKILAIGNVENKEFKCSKVFV